MTIMQKFSLNKQYNQIYEKLVEKDRDFIGMIAYAIYKSEKRSHILSGQHPDNFVNIKSSPTEIKRYRKEAEDIVNNLLASFADQKIAEIKKQISEEIISIANENLEKPSKSKAVLSWHNNGASGIVGNFYTGAVVAIFVWLFSSNEAWQAAKDSALAAVKALVKLIA